MSKTDHPFQSGARVAVTSGWSREEYVESFVEKVHKNGNFTLRGVRQQWRAGCDGWAWATGDNGFRRRSLRLWTPEVDAELSEKIAEAARRNRLRTIRDKIERLKPDDITEAQLDQIEAALP